MFVSFETLLSVEGEEVAVTRTALGEVIGLALSEGEGGGLEDEEREGERFVASCLVGSGLSLASDKSLELLLELAEEERSRRRLLLFT